MADLCRDCFSVDFVQAEIGRCKACGSPRLLGHPELFQLEIVHLDCDAFYANVEKRDDPSLSDKPVIVGGGKRGVVSAACYVARTYGIRSAMPIFKALKACPNAVVIKPDMTKYSSVGRQVRAIMKDYTPLVEPLSLDEAFLDLTGTERLHGCAPAITAAQIAKRIENEIGVSSSVGLSYNKSLAKVASDLDKPRGFSVIGRAEAMAFLAGQPISKIWGAGKSLQRRLAKDGISLIGQLQQMEEEYLIARYGALGKKIFSFAIGEDARTVKAHRLIKSISSEITFSRDVANGEKLRKILWRQVDRVSRRIKATDYAVTTVVLKLRRSDFKILTRSRRLPDPTRLANVIYGHTEELLAKEINGTKYRLLGVGLNGLVDSLGADPMNLADPDSERRANAEHALDRVRKRFGDKAIGMGRGEF